MDNDYQKAPEFKDLTVGNLVANYGRTNITKNVTMLGGVSTKHLAPKTIGNMLVNSGETNTTENLTFGGLDPGTRATPSNEEESYCLGDIGGEADRGLVLVLSYETFAEKSKNRPGNQEDVTAIMNTFKNQKFKVIVKEDKTEQQTNDILDEVSKNQEYKVYPCFVLIILSHGVEAGFRCHDWEIMTFQKMYDYFHRNDCPFVGKPKLFFIQTCRGGKYDHGHTLKDDGQPVIKESLTPNPLVVPKTSDTFAFYSGYNGYLTFRMPRSGSWFIQTLCSMINDYGDKEEQLSKINICRRVGEAISKREGKDEDGVVYKQIQEIKSNLFKKFYFYK